MRTITMLLLAGLGLCGRAAGETYTMTTYYPSPAGVYTDLTVTSGTVLARDSGVVKVGSAARSSSLDVSGDVKINGGVLVPASLAADPVAPSQLVEGAVYYNSTRKTYRVFQGRAWTDLGPSVVRQIVFRKFTEQTELADLVWGQVYKAEITPQSATSRILVETFTSFIGNGYWTTYSTELYKGKNKLTEGYLYAGGDAPTAGNICMSYQDTPGVTTEVVYTVKAKSRWSQPLGGFGGATWNSSGGSWIKLTEIN